MHRDPDMMAAGRALIAGNGVSRRRFAQGVAACALAVAGLPLLAGCGLRSSSSKQPARAYRIGLLLARPDCCLVADLREELRKLGYIEGKNLTFEYRDASDASGRLPALAAEMVALKVDLIVALAAAAVRAAKAATASIPIILIIGGDPVEGGLVASYARPGGNVTGFTFFSRDIAGKRLELLKEAFPTLSRVGYIWDAAEPVQIPVFRETQEAARTMGVQVVSLEVRGPDDFDGAFATATMEQVDALLTSSSGPTVVINEARIVDFAMRSRLPSMVLGKEGVNAGGLMTYAANGAKASMQFADYVDKILKGTNAGELPVIGPTNFDLFINLKTARDLGITIPPAVFAQATEVIQ